MNNAAQAIKKAPESCTRTTALQTVLDQCSRTVWDLFNALNYAGEFDKQEEPKVIASLAQTLYYQLDAARNIACVVDATGKGWPDEQEALAVFTGPRSGYPVDLVTACLDKARGCCGLACAALSHDGQCSDRNILKPDGALTAAAWCIQSQVGTISNVLMDSEKATICPDGLNGLRSRSSLN